MESKVYGLNIHLVAFQLSPDLIHKNEKIRVSITTLPEKKKQHFSINPKLIGSTHHFFTVNVTDKTEKILFVFRRKNFIQADPIVASTVVHADQLPKSPDDKNNNDVKNIAILEPIQKIRKENKGKEAIEKVVNTHRKIVGQMEIQFELTDAFPESEFHHKEGGKKKGHLSTSKGYAKMENDENCDPNLVDN